MHISRSLGPGIFVHNKSGLFPPLLLPPPPRCAKVPVRPLDPYVGQLLMPSRAEAAASQSATIGVKRDVVLSVYIALS